MPLQVQCSQCGQRLQAPDAAAGKRVRCPKCQAAVPVPAADLPPPAVGIGDLLDEYDAREQKQAAAQQQANLLEQQAMAARQRREMERRQAEAEAAQRASEAESDDEGSSFSGWIVFFLIFGVGNVILYLTTGWILIPK